MIINHYRWAGHCISTMDDSACGFYIPSASQKSQNCVLPLPLQDGRQRLCYQALCFTLKIQDMDLMHSHIWISAYGLPYYK